MGNHSTSSSRPYRCLIINNRGTWTHNSCSNEFWADEWCGPVTNVKIVDLEVTTNPANGQAYRIGEFIDIDVTFSKVVDVGGDIFVHIFVGGQWRGPRYESGSGTKILRFRYTVQPGDGDDSGIQIGGTHQEIVALGSGGSVKHKGNNVKRTFSGNMVWTSLPDHKVDPTRNCGEHDCTNADCTSKWNESLASSVCTSSQTITLVPETEYWSPACNISVTRCNDGGTAEMNVALDRVSSLYACEPPEAEVFHLSFSCGSEK